jgi:hypothetical protein
MKSLFFNFALGIAFLGVAVLLRANYSFAILFCAQGMDVQSCSQTKSTVQYGSALEVNQMMNAYFKKNGTLDNVTQGALQQMRQDDSNRNTACIQGTPPLPNVADENEEGQSALIQWKWQRKRNTSTDNFRS